MPCARLRRRRDLRHDEGRRRVGPGDALAHQDFDGHLDLIGPYGAEILDLPLPPGRALPTGLRIADPDQLARIAENDPAEAAALLDGAESGPPLLDDWPDLLATTLRLQSHLRIADWAAAMRLAPANVSRSFRAVFGMSLRAIGSNPGRAAR